MRNPFQIATQALVLGASLLAAAPASADDRCTGCGTVTDIQPRVVEGKSSGAGAVMGAIVGGVVGHQFGSGRGNDAATAAGAVGGAVAGNQIEKNRQGTVYDVSIRMNNDGSTRVITVDSLGALHTGDRVEILGGNRIQRM